MNPADFSEHTLVEQPAVALFRDLDYATVSEFNETFGPHGTLGRETTGEVVLDPDLTVTGVLHRGSWAVEPSNPQSS